MTTKLTISKSFHSYERVSHIYIYIHIKIIQKDITKGFSFMYREIGVLDITLTDDGVVVLY